MVEIQFLKEIVIIFALSVASLFICHRFKLPPIIGFLITGLTVGPYGLGLISSIHQVEILAEIGIVMLLFTIGIEFSLSDLLKSKRAVLGAGFLQVSLIIGASVLILQFFDIPLNKAVFMGFLIAVSSTAIVLKILQDKSELETAHGRWILSILIFEDIIVVPMMIFTPILAGVAGNLVGSLLALLGKGLAVIVVVVILSRFIIPKVLFQIVRTRSPELFLLSTVLICFAVAWVTNSIGLSLGLGAFLAGLVISESEYSHQALEGVLPFKVIFTSFFFVSIGMLLDVSLFAAKPILIVTISLAVLLIKFIIAASVALILGMSSRAAIIVGLAMFQVGEFSFILIGEGLSRNLLDESFYQMFLAVSILTMGITPFAIEIAPSVADRISRWPLLRIFRAGSYRWLAVHQDDHMPHDDHLVIIGFGVNGRNIARAARSANIPYVVIETNPETVRLKRQEGEPILYGDATSRSVLRHAHVSRARIVVVAISDALATRKVTHSTREASPNAHLIVRTRFVSETQALLELGANDVVPEEFETSVEIFTRVMMKYLVPRDEIEKFTTEIRSHSYSMLRSPSGIGASVADLKAHVPEIEIQSIRISKNSPIAGRTIAEAQIRTRYGVSVVAIMRRSKLITNPASGEKLESDDILYVLGTTEHCAKAARKIG